MAEAVTPAGYHALGVVTLAERQALELVHGRGLSQRAAALTIGVSRAALRSRLENAMRKITAYEARAA